MACGKLVEGAGVTGAYPCMVEIPDGAVAHRGPCAAREIDQSMRRRQQWEQEGEDAARTLAATQQTRVGAVPQEHPAPVPQPKAAPVEEASPEPRAPGSSLGAFVEQQQRGAAGQPGPIRASEEQFAKTHDRPEDQPMPVPNNRPFAHNLLVERIESRLALGIHRYGTGLQSFNGRQAALDALEEIIDAAVYLETFLGERTEILLMLNEIDAIVANPLYTLGQNAEGVHVANPLPETDRLREIVGILRSTLGADANPA